MPTFDLRESAPLDVLEFDVVGERESMHVSHVAVALDKRDGVRFEDGLRAAHMMPPLTREVSVAAHVIGRLHLSRDEIRNIRDWLDDQTAAFAAIRPAFRQYYLVREDTHDRTSKMEARRRFSCSTFVQDCFRESIDVTLVDEASLPPTGKDTLVRVWGADRVRRGRLAGLTGEGPWPVLLPAHILHALDRDDPRESAYRPQLDDWDFPRAT
ncbi:hypothetical protein ACNOYE_17720 [Nannocystaceae bacterium ST9]